MEARVVTAVRLHPKNGRVLRVRLGTVDTDTNKWIQQPAEVDVEEVVDALHGDERVWTIFEVEGQHVLGPLLELTVHEHGFEGIEVVNVDENGGRTVSDLPRI
ncbi:MAG: hypothetical protein ACM3SS_19605 [Rhodospirillaceae bacterium]